MAKRRGNLVGPARPVCLVVKQNGSADVHPCNRGDRILTAWDPHRHVPPSTAYPLQRLQDTLLPIPVDQPSLYELGVLEQISAWRTPPSGVLRDAYDRVWKLVDGTTDMLRELPGVDWTLDTFVAGVIERLNELAHGLVASDEIYRSYAVIGLPVDGPGDVHHFDLRHVDEQVSTMRARYTAVAGVEGATTGFVGAIGIVPDVLALTTLNLKATAEYATHYGFDVRRPEERLFALQVLSAASGATDMNKEFALKPLTRASQGIAKQQALESASQYAITGSIKKLAEKLGVTLTRAKMAQVLPVAGAVVGGGLNVLYTNKVCLTAQQVYRERFLISRYGPDVLHAISRPGSD